jgi:hypothetical protein
MPGVPSSGNQPPTRLAECRSVPSVSPAPSISHSEKLTRLCCVRYLYTLILALDANFCMKNHNCSNSRDDPGLHTGKVYFIPNEPYEVHILKNAMQADVSPVLASGYDNVLT